MRCRARELPCVARSLSCSTLLKLVPGPFPKHMASQYIKVVARLLSTRSAAIIRATAITISAAPNLPKNRSYSTGIAQDIMASRLDSLVHQRYMELDTSGSVMVTYIWIDGTNVSITLNFINCTAQYSVLPLLHL